MLQDLPDPAWILRPELEPALDAMRQARLTLDLLVKPHQLAAILRFAGRHPDLPMVLDHCGKPDIANGHWQDWAGNIAAIARDTGMVCKLSGLVTEAGEGWSDADLRPWIAHVLGCFGPQRIIWGSDWPVARLASSYARWRNAAARALGPLGILEKQAIFGANAVNVYCLEVPKNAIAKAFPGA